MDQDYPRDETVHFPSPISEETEDDSGDESSSTTESDKVKDQLLQSLFKAGLTGLTLRPGRRIEGEGVPTTSYNVNHHDMAEGMMSTEITMVPNKMVGPITGRGGEQITRYVFNDHLH